MPTAALQAKAAKVRMAAMSSVRNRGEARELRVRNPGGLVIVPRDHMTVTRGRRASGSDRYYSSPDSNRKLNARSTSHSAASAMTPEEPPARTILR